MSSSKLRLLVISDLHAIVSKEQNSDSHLFFENGSSEYGESFIKYAKELKRDIDVLVCAGDISNESNQKGFLAGWEFIQKIKNSLGIPELLCVPGNHDHQSRSRSIDAFDPKQHLQFVSPMFPFSCKEKNTHFWAWHWCHSDGKDFNYNAISLNTSAYHGFDDEWQHGRIVPKITEQISKFVSSDTFKRRSINILLCHHHPQKMEHVDGIDIEAMSGGQNLLRQLDCANKGPWLVIHGHKHFADITYASTQSMNRPVIFSSGSLAAKLYPKIEDRTANQFYIIEIDLDRCVSKDQAVGTFETHENLIGRRWAQSQSSNLPAKGGFGSVESPKSVADKISKRISDENPYLNKQDLSKFHDLTNNFTPIDFDRLVAALENNGLSVDRKHNVIIEVGRPND